MNLVKRLSQHGVDRFKRGKGCEAQRGKAVWQHQSDAKQGALRDLTFRTEANMQAVNMLIDSPPWRPNWSLLSACARRSQRPTRSGTSISPQFLRRRSSVRDGISVKLGSYRALTLVYNVLRFQRMYQWVLLLYVWTRTLNENWPAWPSERAAARARSRVKRCAANFPSSDSGLCAAKRCPTRQLHAIGP